MKTQNEEILEYLKAGHTLTSKDAFMIFGITRLSARIFDLRKHHNIIDKMISVKTRNGKDTQVAEYRLAKITTLF